MRFFGFVLLLVLIPQMGKANEFVQRSIDFQAGLSVGDTASGNSGRDAFDFTPGVALGVRYYPKSWLWLAVQGGAEMLAGGDVENIEMMPLFSLGGAVGLRADIGARLAFYGGMQTEFVHLRNAPKKSVCLAIGCESRESFNSWRVGPVAAAAVHVGNLFAHPIAIEAKLSYLNLQGGDDFALDAIGALQGGVYLTGTLAPDPGKY